MHSPTDVHWIVANRLLTYLKGTFEYRHMLYRLDTFDNTEYKDVDWASCPDDRKYIGDCGIYMSNSLIS